MKHTAVLMVVLMLVSKSGKVVKVDQLSPDEQRRVALAWNVLHASR